MPQVRDLLDRQVSGSFVGRTEELCSLHDILADEGPVVVHLHGIAGIGKSRLLGAFVQVARAEGATVVRLDCRGIEPTEAGLLSELGNREWKCDRLGRRDCRAPRPRWDQSNCRSRHLRMFRLMDTWLRRCFLPILPDNVRFILCGREAPVTAWLSDPGWHGLFRSIRLESMEQRDAVELLSRAGVSGRRCQISCGDLPWPPFGPHAGGFGAPYRADRIDGRNGATRGGGVLPFVPRRYHRSANSPGAGGSIGSTPRYLTDSECDAARCIATRCAGAHSGASVRAA